MTTEKEYVFCLVAGDTQTHVHIAHCQDINRGLALDKKTIGGSNPRAYRDAHNVMAESPEEAIRQEVEELNAEFGDEVWSDQYFTIMPCCRKLQ